MQQDFRIKLRVLKRRIGSSTRAVVYLEGAAGVLRPLCRGKGRPLDADQPEGRPAIADHRGGGLEKE